MADPVTKVPAQADSAAMPSATAQSDDGWKVESASVSVEPAPADTTAKPTETLEKATSDEPEREAHEPAEVTPSASATEPAVKTKPKGAVTDRKKALTDDINRLTYEKRETEREVARLKAEAAALTRRPATEATPATRQTRPTKAALPPRPDHPEYKEFETDEDYNAAVAKWRTDDAAWLEARETALKTDITGGVEARLRTERAMQAARQAEEDTLARIDEVRVQHDDWDEKQPALANIVSPWADPERGVKAPFLSDVVQSSPESGEILYWAMSEPEAAQAFANLRPTRAMRDAVVESSSPLQLVQHFATPEGQREFAQLQAMHPIRLMQMVGALSARLAAASSGPASTAPHPITSAHPSAKPPVGTPRARTETGPAAPTTDFTDWMAQEDAKDNAARRRALWLTG